MTYNTKISIKNQITIPVKILEESGLNAGDIISITFNEDTKELVLKNMAKELEKLGGLLNKYSKPNKLSIDMDQIIEESKNKYFKQKYDPSIH